MGKNSEKTESLSTLCILAVIILTAMTTYWHMAPVLAEMGYKLDLVNMIFLEFRQFFEQPYKVKALGLLFIVCSGMMRTGKKVETTWGNIIAYCVIGSFLYVFIPNNPFLHLLMTVVGMPFALYGFSLAFRKMKNSETPSDEEGFLQNETLIETNDSVNIPYVYTYKGKEHKGWIDVINPYRATMILGSPGSGKSFAVYNAFIEQQLRKGFTMFLYDYKFPDLTERVLTEIAYQSKHEGLWKDMKVKPQLFIINFDDPMKSNRCNPIHHSYINDPADTTEIADLVFKNINKGSSEKGFDFFNESAKVYLDALVWFLANYDPDAVYNNEEGLTWVLRERGQAAYDAIDRKLKDDPDGSTVIDSRTDYVNRGCYCTFPHVIELMAFNYKKTFQVLKFTKGLEAKISPFASALEGGAMEQLQGQIASAQIPMGKFVSPALYWVMTGDDFTLDINNPDEPKIVCMGNNPDRQSIYGTTLALYTSRMFKLINHKHKLKSAVLLDELPTIFIKGLDNLIATARSNKVAIALGAQDKSQLRRDYGDKESEVIMTTVGNLFSGSVEGRTAKDISDTFGKEFRKRVSQSIGEDSNSQSISYQLEDILPASRIVDMTQGMFCGWVKDNFGQSIKRKKFYGAITVDAERNKKLEAEAVEVPMITQFFNDGLPEMPEADKTRLEKIWPADAGNEKKIYNKYLTELVNVEVNANFNRVKKEVEDMVNREFERTMPLAERYRAENENEN